MAKILLPHIDKPPPRARVKPEGRPYKTNENAMCGHDKARNSFDAISGETSKWSANYERERLDRKIIGKDKDGKADCY